MKEEKEMNVHLIPMELSQADSLARLLSDREVFRGLSDEVPFPYTEQHGRDFIATALSEGSSTVARAVCVGGQVAGIAGYERGMVNKSHVAVIGYWLGRQYWGQGIATQALGQLLEIVRADPRVKRIEATAFDFNVASQRVLEKNGFVREALLQNALTKNGKLYDEVVYCLPVNDKE